MEENEVIEVRAIDLGYYDHLRRKEGVVFTIKGYEDFSSRWMEFVDESHVEAWNEFIEKKIKREAEAPVYDEYSTEARIEKAKIKKKNKKKKKRPVSDDDEVIVPKTASVIEQEMVARKIAKGNTYQSGKKGK